MSIELKMPALSPTMEEGTLAKWLVKEGDKVASGDILAEIETDKATMEFEAVDEGTVGGAHAHGSILRATTISGRPAADQARATTKYPSRRSRRSRAVDRIPSRVSATTTIGNWKTSAIASITIVANE